MTLGRTVAELHRGSAAFRPISGKEYAQWYAFFLWRRDAQKNKGG